MVKWEMRRKRAAQILIVDDHPIVREGLTALISRQPDLNVCGEAADLADAIKLVDDMQPDVAVIDISLKSGNGLDLIARIKQRNDSVRMLVSSMYDETLYAERSLRAGAMGYLNKQEATRQIITAIRRVFDGKVYLSNRMSQRLMHRMVSAVDKLERPAVDVLSDRELEVFQLIGGGLTTAEIAERLHVTVKTIETHRQRIKGKLNLKNSAQLARDATTWVLENG